MGQQELLYWWFVWSLIDMERTIYLNDFLMNLNCISDRFHYIFLLWDIRKQFPQFSQWVDVDIDIFVLPRKQHMKIVTNEKPGSPENISIQSSMVWLGSVNKETTLHTYTMQAPSAMNYTFTSCTLCMHGLNALNSRQKENIKMSHSKSQIEPRWLMSHRLGTPGLSHTCEISSE